MDREIVTLLVGTGIGVLWYNRDNVHRITVNSLIWLASLSMDTYVDLKWKYLGASVVEQSDQERCELDTLDDVSDRATVYRYNNNKYIALDRAMPPIKSHIDIEYNEDEQLHIDIHYHEDHLVPGMEDHQLLVDLMRALAGPLYDFHERTPSITMIETVYPGTKIDHIKKIIVRTDYLREYVLES